MRLKAYWKDWLSKSVSGFPNRNWNRWGDVCVKYPAQSATLQPQRDNDIII